jgi:alpha-ketoglutarate-dependent taurine dioxygenase
MRRYKNKEEKPMSQIDFIEQQGIMTLNCAKFDSPESFVQWQLDNSATLDALMAQHGALLFRDCGVQSTDSFSSYMSCLGKKQLDYVDGNSPRTRVKDNVYTSTEFPSEYAISMHNELSYSNQWPAHLYFCCVVPPLQNGHTRLADCRKVWSQLDDDLVAKFAQHGVRYTRFLHGGMGVGPSWQQTFETEDAKTVEAFCKQSKISFNWCNNGLQLSQQGPGLIEHPHTGEMIWFNQADQFHPSNLAPKVASVIKMLAKGDPLMFPTNAFYGDGSLIDEQTLVDIRAVFSRNTLLFSWQQGDLLWVDNVLMAHGRSPFEGERKILVAMT